MKSLLSNARKTQNLKSKELAQKLGVDQALISKFENGKRIPTESQVLKLAEVLKIPFDILVKAWLKEKIKSELLNYSFADDVLLELHEELSSYKTEDNYEDNSILEMLSEINDLKAKLDKIRQFESFRIQDALKLEYTYESNRIEGNTLNLRETDLVINKGLTISGKTMREHLEVINHHEAIEYINDLVSKKVQLNERELLSIHNLVLRGILPDEAGKYRSVPVMIQGSAHMPPQPFLVRKKVEDFFMWFQRNQRNLHPIILAAEVHERIVTIHPFIDGNGRTSRLLMNLILLSSGFVIANIKGDDHTRMAYYEALENVQTGKSKESFIKFVAQVELEGLKRYLTILGE